MHFRPGIGIRRLLGLVLLATGAGILYMALPSWIWFLALGGSLIVLGWAIFREEKRL